MRRRRVTNRSKKADRTGALVVTAIIASFVAISLMLPQFYISRININGLRVIDREKLIATGELKTGKHLLYGINGSFKNVFSLRHTQSEQKLLKSLPYLKSVVIKSVFPSVLSVVLEERVEVAYISIEDGCVIIDANGIALEVIERDNDLDIPVIEGIQAFKVMLGQKVAVDLADYLDQSIVLLNDIINADKDARLEVKLLSCTTSIRPVQDKIFFLTLNMPQNKEELIVKVKTDTGTPGKMTWLRYALQQGSLSGYGKGVLDLTSTQRIFIPEKK
jgi:cell division septal protein FtsQ